jgi:hypothetical protein
MRKLNSRMATALFVLGAFAVAASLATEARSQEPAVDPAAIQILKGMTDYLGSLDQFSADTRVLVEDLLGTGQRVDLEAAASAVVKRPNMLFSERSDDLTKQSFYYDGKTLTLYDQSKDVYATVVVPGTLEGMFDFARQTLGLLIPASDLIYPNAFELLTQDLTSAMVIGKEDVGGITCDHLAFRQPGVDFQIWVSDVDPPRPCKMVVTDPGTPALLSVTTLIHNFNATPDADDALFVFVPPAGAMPVTFLPLE